MTRRDYVLVADRLASARPWMTPRAHKRLCYLFAHVFQAQSVRFNSTRFLQACGVAPTSDKTSKRKRAA